MNAKAYDKKTLRRIAHHLDPVVIIGDSGMSEGVVQETERALTDHELIKVRINSADRADRVTTGDSLATSCNADVVQRIGKVLILYRANPKANPKLSNLQRFAGGA